MDQQACLQTPSHFTHLGVCYVGTQANLNLSNPDNPQPTNFSVTGVPEPGMLALIACAAILFSIRRLRAFSAR